MADAPAPLTEAALAAIEARAPYESALLRTWADNDRKRGASIPAEAMERIAALIDNFASLPAEVRRLREALATLPCPYPAVRDAITVRACIATGECSCDNRAALGEASNG